MSALTRILNNQIFNQTIIASQKIQPGSITGTLFASNVTVPGDLLIAGNLFVLGSSQTTTIASTNTYVNDPLVVLNNGFAGTNTYDEGLVFNRGTSQNRAFIWSEYFKEFRLIGTTESGTTYGNVAASNFANLHIGNLTVDYNITHIGDFLSNGFINTSANISAAVGLFGGVTTTGYINAGGNVSTPQLNAGQINTTGNVLATAGVFNALTVNGNESVTGYLNVGSNIMAAAATFNSSQINGNQSVTGYLNVSGNVLASAGTLNTLAINSSTNANESTGSSGALQIKGGVSIAKDLWIGGNVYASNIFGVTHQIITVQDPLVYFDAANTYPYNYDIGFYSNFVGPNPIDNTGNAYQHSGVVRDNSDNTWKFFSNVRSEPAGTAITFDSDTIFDPIRAGNLTLTYTQTSTSATTGSFKTAGGAGIGGNLNIAGDTTGIAYSGRGRLTVGLDVAGGTLYPENLVQFTSNANSFSRVSIQNISTSQNASSDFVAISDLGSNVAGTIVTGIASSTFNSTVLAPVIKPSDGYTYTSTGNLVLSGKKDIVLSANGVNNVDVRISATHGNIGVQRNTAAFSAYTGALTSVGGISTQANLYVGGGAYFNSLLGNEPFVISSSTSGNIAFAANVQGTVGTTESVIIGGGNLTIQPGAVLKVGGATSMMVPVGPTGARPSSQGANDVAGMLRFNTTISALEFYDGTDWNIAGSVFTVISGRQFSGNVAGGYGNVDGTNTTFTLQAQATTAGTIISINGVMQFPTLAYSVSGNVLTFTEPPAPGDVIDARILTTTSTVSSITNATGINQLIADDDGTAQWTGTQDGGTVRRTLVDPAGDFNFQNGTDITYTQTAVNIAANNTPYVIATRSQTTFTSGKLIVTAKRGTGATGNVETYEAQVITDGDGNAYISTYGVTNNGYAMGVLSANVLAGNVQVYYTGVIASSVVQANVKCFGTYIL